MNLQFGYCIAFLLATSQRLSEAGGPEFGAPIPPLRVIAGQEAALKCIVNDLYDLEKFKVAWINVQNQVLLTMNNQVIHRTDPRIMVSNPHPNEWLLHLKNVTPGDSGFYACQVNTMPIKSQAGYLDVVVPPEFSSNMTNRNITVVENHNVTISCKANGNPAPKIVWKREDGLPFITQGHSVKHYSGDELVLIGVSRHHMAAYLCVASNGVQPGISRRIYLDVTFPPLIYIPNQLVGAAERSNITLECFTEAHPSSRNDWLRDGDQALPKSERYVTHLIKNSYKSHMSLTIRYLEHDDYGSYKCVARNEIGATEGSITLYKLKMPPLTTPSVSTERVTTRTSIRTTITVTTEGRAINIETERRNNSHIPGFQQKYGDGRSQQKSRASGAPNTLPGVLLIAIIILKSVFSIHRR